jgi:hypothetical protein
MMTDLKLSTAISDDLLQQIRDYLDAEADMYAGGSDPAQAYEANRPLRLLRELDSATGGELLARRKSN